LIFRGLAERREPREQLEELLSQVNETSDPVVIAGDLSTTGSDSTPTSVLDMLYKQFGSADFDPAVSIPCMPWQLPLLPLSLPSAIETIVGFRLSRTASPGAISFARITGSNHFPSDVFFGGAMGFVIARYAVLPAR
jgi:hypothetical protein